MSNVPLGSYRRNLPHWRLTGAAYFVTFRLHERQPYLGSQDRTLVAEILRRRDGRDYRLDAFVVMNDHVHTLVVPSEGQDLSRILHAWKSVSARDLQRLTGRTGSVWQREYFDRIIRDESEWFEKLRYIAANPYRRWPELSEYAWVHPALR